jgi:hypothetical protein
MAATSAMIEMKIGPRSSGPIDFNQAASPAVPVTMMAVVMVVAMPAVPPVVMAMMPPMHFRGCRFRIVLHRRGGAGTAERDRIGRACEREDRADRSEPQ